MNSIANSIIAGFIPTGMKTVVGIIGYALVSIAAIIDKADVYLTPDIESGLLSLFIAIGGLGVAGKVDKVTEAIDESPDWKGSVRRGKP